jgi:enolase
MSAIAQAHARQILDSQGYPTVEVEVRLASGQVGRAAVPAGSSTGRFEAAELRDGGERWSAMGVGAAVEAVRGEIAATLRGHDPHDQPGVDEVLIALDGTREKARLGANAMLATSLAVARAAAADEGAPLWRYLSDGHPVQLPVQLPVPLLDVLNGGLHAANRLDFEEVMIIPAGAGTFSDALRIGVEVFHELRYTPLARGRSVLMGADGGFAPDLESNESALETLVTAIRGAGYEPGWDVWIGIDVAATQLRDGGRYALAHEGRQLSSDELVGYYDELTDRYPVLLLEDGMGDDDWPGWHELTAHLGRRIELAADDLFVTSAERLRDGIAAGVANAIVIKPNQVGTLTETLETIRVAQASGYATVIAQRSGETQDTSICDLAVATGSTQIKAGAPSRERVAKYNRLLRIEEMLGSDAKFAGLNAFYPDKWEASA